SRRSWGATWRRASSSSWIARRRWTKSTCSPPGTESRVGSSASSDGGVEDDVLLARRIEARETLSGHRAEGAVAPQDELLEALLDRPQLLGRGVAVPFAEDLVPSSGHDLDTHQNLLIAHVRTAHVVSRRARSSGNVFSGMYNVRGRRVTS